ncbi:MAG: methionyl-tRNA formyltransferase [Chloroflexi bacterium]|nr:methionyl-tRNA formyltransferase [Chloroflexota bacterium]
MRIAFMGTPQFSVPTLERLNSSEYEVMAVYAQPDRPSGRGKTASSTPVKRIAEKHGLSVFQPTSLRDEAEIERLAALSPDAIVVVAYGQILPQEILEIPKFGCLNIHPSLLPKYRGAAPVTAAILAGDEETGVSVMLMDSGMDTGPVLSRQKILIEPHDTTESLEEKLANVGADLLMKTLPEWIEQKLVPERQDNSKVIYTGQISKKDGEMNWLFSAVELERRVRAFYPWPGCFTYWQGKVLKILDAVALPGANLVEPGVVVALSQDPEIPVGIGTGDGVLGICRIQIEGKKPNLSRDFLRGQRDFIGERVGQ